MDSRGGGEGVAGMLGPGLRFAVTVNYAFQSKTRVYLWFIAGSRSDAAMGQAVMRDP